MDCTASQLADMLDGMENFPHSTGGLSMLDEATLAFGRKSHRIAELQQAFANARYAHMHSWSTEAQAYSADAWRTAMSAAHSLAAALRELSVCWWDHAVITGEPVVRLDHSFCSWSCYEEWMESYL